MCTADGTHSVDALLDTDAGAIDDAELKDLLRELVRLRGRLDAVESSLIGELDHRRCYADDGAVSAKAWLAHETGIARGAAGARVLLAKRLRRMPQTAEALRAGGVTEAHARSMGRCLTPRTVAAFERDEAMLVGVAEQLEADDFDVAVTHWLRLHDAEGADPGAGRESTVRASRTLDGRVRIDGDLDCGDGAELLAELDAVRDELWRADQRLEDGDPLKARSHSERTAAALIEMARRSSTVRSPDRLDDSEPESVPPNPEPAGGDTVEGEAPGGGRPRRPQLLVVVDLDERTGTSSAALEDGTLLPREVLERWSCDASWARVVMSGRSLPIDLGAATYSPSAAQRRALIARDRRCVVPGCRRPPRWCEAHHVVPWPHGPTDLSNLVLMCARHHKVIHAGGLMLVRGDDRWQVVRPDGTPLRERPPPATAAILGRPLVRT